MKVNDCVMYLRECFAGDKTASSVDELVQAFKDGANLRVRRNTVIAACEILADRGVIRRAGAGIYRGK